MRGEQMGQGEGERLHSQRQRNFWKLLAVLAAIGALCGFIAGSVSGFADGSGREIDPTVKLVGAAGVILGALAAIYFSWRFFVSVDEVEVADNLWGSLFGLYAYAFLLPSWWALHQLGFVPPPDHWLIYGVTMITALIAYGWRKMRLR